MKRLAYFCLALVLVFGLVACGGGRDQEDIDIEEVEDEALEPIDTEVVAPKNVDPPAEGRIMDAADIDEEERLAHGEAVVPADEEATQGYFFRMTYGTKDGGPLKTYEMRPDGEGALMSTLDFQGGGEPISLTHQVGTEAWSKLDELLKTYEIMNWNGFDGAGDGIPAEGAYFELEYDKREFNLYAQSDQALPVNFYEVYEAIGGFFINP